MKEVELEYLIKTSPKILYTKISTAAGLEEWFAEKVFIKDNIITFYWDKSPTTARIEKPSSNSLRFYWTESETNSFFELKIEELELINNDLALIITDCVEWSESETKDSWDVKIDKLKLVLGDR
ncbi:MAG: hypothetical protein LBV69_05265 [Bacteroidales bacterium]|jgi:hypothetical protein|nr:hypothetical protein [Bacteroidales bacterium]